ncbi:MULTISPECIES: FAD-dependent oxidoreductase [Gordonia]|uniref:FAD-dependent oxidoreductase n=1 Tax=Gordonia TaxID=2053 RepID=UPI0030181650
MSHVITQSCCNDAGCVAACPVNCIHPTPDEPAFATADMLYVDPATCIDCGACVPECPVDAIVHADALRPNQQVFVDINAAYYRDHDVRDGLVPFRPAPPTRVHSPARVAVVGAGPAGLYAAAELLTEPNVHVDVIERLPTPLGLIRAGVAPDHPSTKKAGDVLDSTTSSPRFRYLLGIDVGVHVTPDDLSSSYDAVVFAHGAPVSKTVGVPGEDRAGYIGSGDFVAWYNGHPDAAGLAVDLSADRAVVIGNGNVALDVARVLLADPDALATTDIADHALDALRSSAVREVVILGRRGPANAAFTVGEVAALVDLPADIVVGDPVGDESDADNSAVALLRTLVDTRTRSHDRRLVFRFDTTPRAVLGDRSVTGLEVDHDGSADVIETGLIIGAVGFRGAQLDGLPFDSGAGTVPHRDGRVVDAESGEIVAGQYVAGWIKRGARGGIGANRRCAEETARSVIDDLATRTDRRVGNDVVALAERNGACVIDADGWRRIDAAERTAGSAEGRPRIKIADVSDLLAVGAEVALR